MSNSPSQPLDPAATCAPETRKAWNSITHLLTEKRENWVNVAGLHRRNAVLTADALIRRLVESGPCAHDGPVCHYCDVNLYVRKGEKAHHAPGCLWQDANEFTAQEAV